MPKDFDQLIDRDLAQQKFHTEMHQKEREVLFENEALVIKVLQAVSGASLVAAFAQAKTLIEMASRISFLLFLTAMTIALVAAVVAAHWKHQYKMWDVKAAASEDVVERDARLTKAGAYLTGMRRLIWTSLILFGSGFAQLLAVLWWVVFIPGHS